MKELISFARFIVFDDKTFEDLYHARAEALNAHLANKNENNKDDDDSENLDEVFIGHLNPVSKENELAAWKYIEKIVDDELG